MNKQPIRIFLLSIFLLSISVFEISAQSKNLQAGYYLTVAAYAKSKEQYAKAYTDKVRGMGFEAEYDFFPKKNYYFVYLKYYDDFNTSIRGLYQTRKNTDFDDCWVYIMKQAEVAEKALNKEVESLDDMFAKRFSNISDEDGDDENIEDSELDSAADTLASNMSPSIDDNAAIATTESTPGVTTKIDKSKNQYVFLSLFHGRSSKEVSGQVQVIDATNNRLIKKHDANKVITMKNPENGNGNLILISEVFGYKKVQHNFNYLNPIDDEEYPYVTNIEDTVIVNFELSRYSKGDIVTMYNVFFFKDAAIMRPQSQYEVNELVTMLKENPNMKIKIHGHTNGNSHGKIISLEESGNKYFALSPSNKTSFGSSKKLSHARASIMKRYLVKQGIPTHSIELKAWGGKAKIHHKLSNLAHQNVRVEIEVTHD